MRAEWPAPLHLTRLQVIWSIKPIPLLDYGTDTIGYTLLPLLM